jgi:glucosylceramidase
VKDRDESNGARLQLWDCHGGTNQHWVRRGASSRPSSTDGETGWWLTKGDRSQVLARQAASVTFGAVDGGQPFIDVDPASEFQTIDGFGFALTGGSADVIHALNVTDRIALLTELFGRGPNDIGIDYLRLSIGASDLSSRAFTYDDLPPGQTDAELRQFSLAPEQESLLPLLREILQIRPELHIMAAPWSAPSPTPRSARTNSSPTLR